MKNEVRVRFAPSPTGALHIGGIRTALYNYLFARQQKGKMILRIEDTDQTRLFPGAEQYIQESLDWCGIHPDESPFAGGPFGPYRQSERKDLYNEYVNQLVENGHAYYAFDTAEELDAMRERLKAARVASPQYNAITRGNMKNSLTLPEDEVRARIDNGEDYVIRLKIPRKEEIRFHDLIRGWIMVHSSSLDDKVLMKSDGMPTYHMANIVDDHLMQISHVIRGEEWLPSAPTHVLLYKYLGWEKEMPQFAHLPLILKPDGNGKLSKRDAEKHGFPIFPLEWKADETGEGVKGFREEGYLPEAFINFLAFLGWNPGNDQEIFSMNELIESFSIPRIGKAGTKFDIHKAQWYNQQYLKAKPAEELADFLIQHAEKAGYSCNKSYAIAICELMKDRVTFPQDFWNEGQFFFMYPQHYDEKIVNKKWTEEAVNILQDFSNQLKTIQESNVSPEKMKEVLTEVLDKHQVKMGKVMQALRVAVTGEGSGPDLMGVLAILGPEETASRIEKALQTLGNQVKT